jgi:beta-N-acetylhexosaminidase
MKKFVILLLLLLTAAGSGCHTLPKEKTAAPPSTVQETWDDKADKAVSAMSTRQKIGQLLMIGVSGSHLDEETRVMLEEYPFGNVILFDRNLKNPDQVRTLNQELKKTMKNTSGGLQPFVAIDQEGGYVRRMKNYLPAMPSARALGQTSPEQTKQWAVKTGSSLRNLGFTLNFAPVVDLNSAKNRSYGSTPQQVVPYAKAAIDGYSSVGLSTCLKHFPGIGKVQTDPHDDGDVVTLTREELDQEDGRPFRELISQTHPEYTYVMVSNVTFPQLDARQPACLSAAVMNTLLRGTYHYEGIILTDDMEMGAMAKHYAFAEMGVRAVESGADIVLVCHDYDHMKEVFDGLLSAYESSKIDKARVDEAVHRVVRTKLFLAEKEAGSF